MGKSYWINSTKHFRIISIPWIFGIFTAILRPGSMAYFGLTGKSHLRDLKQIETEAIFIAGDVKSDKHIWNENGYYTAPSNGYARVDLSPKPDKDLPQTRGQRKKKNVLWRQSDIEGTGDKATRHEKSGTVEREMFASLPLMKEPYSGHGGRTIHQLPKENLQVSYMIPTWTYLQPRRYPAQQYGYISKAQRYGRDNSRMSATTLASRLPTYLRGMRGTYRRPPSKQAVSRPIKSVTVDGITVEKDADVVRKEHVPNAYIRRRRPHGSFRRINVENQDKTIPPRQTRTRFQANVEGDQGIPDVDPRMTERNPAIRLNHETETQDRRRSENGRKRHLHYTMYRTPLHAIESLPSRQKSIENTGPKHIPMKNITTSPGIDQSTLKPKEELEINQDIPSLMTFMETSQRQPYSKFKDDLNSSSLSPVVDPKTGSRVTDLPALFPVENIDKKKARKKCDDIKLSKKQNKFCRRDPGMPQVLEEATVISVAECQYQFRFERWNCSTGKTRINLLTQGNRETAFLFAISSAGLTHTVARACAQGHLERCSCEETYADNINQEAWIWGGCGDNVQFAAKFVRQFLKPKTQNKDIRAEVDKHNSDMGIRVVKQSVQQTCKCHGVSGSCTTKTCWRKVLPFYEIGQKIKQAYDLSVKVGSINSSNGRPKLIRLRRSRRNRPEISNGATTLSTLKSSATTTIPPVPTKVHYHGGMGGSGRVGPVSDSVKRTIKESSKDYGQHGIRMREDPRNNELVYLENSPAYCKVTRFSLGTKGRICDKEKNCDRICCGRGHSTHIRIVRRSCECEVKWCCYVKCKTCTERKEIYTCK